MSTVPTILVDGNDLTDWLQDRSMSVKRNSLDATFIDKDGMLPAIPLLGDTVELDEPAWTGTINSVVSTGYKGNVPFYKVHAQNEDVLPDLGAAPFNLADTGTPYSSPAGFKDLEVTRILDNATEEVRSKCIIFKEGVMWGMEIDITSVVEGYTAETFTVMEMTVEWPIDDAASYTLDLGLGVFADATTGGEDGGPLDPPTLEDEIGRIARDNCCDDDAGPSPGDTVPVVPITAGGVCTTGDNKDLTWSYTLSSGTFSQTLGASGSGNYVGSWVDANAAYTDPDYPCALGGGSWSGYQDHELWLQFTAPADDPTTYLGLTTFIDTSGLDSDGLPHSYVVKIAQGAAASTRFGQGTVISGPGPFGPGFDIYIPRNLIDWGAVNCIVLAPDWLCDRPARFCNPPGNFSNPHDDGRANSGSFDTWGFDDICPFGLTTGVGEAEARGVPGVGDVDGSNAEFELLSWTGTGEVSADVNGLPEIIASYDIGGGTVTLQEPPPVNAVVLFTYRAST